MAQSTSSRAKSTRFWLVVMRTSISGCLAWKRCRRGTSQPSAKVVTRLTFNVPELALAADPLQRVGHAVERVAQIGQQRLALAGDLEAARTAHKQGDAEPLLERLHLMADGRLGDVKLLGGVGETRVTGGGLEGAQGIQR